MMRTMSNSRHNVRFNSINKRSVTQLRERNKEKLLGLRRELRADSVLSLRKKDGLDEDDLGHDFSFFNVFGYHYDLVFSSRDLNTLILRINQHIDTCCQSVNACDEVDCSSLHSQPSNLRFSNVSTLEERSVVIIKDIIAFMTEKRLCLARLMDCVYVPLLSNGICVQLLDSVTESDSYVFNDVSIDIFLLNMTITWANSFQVIDHIVHALAVISSMPKSNQLELASLKLTECDTKPLKELEIKQSQFVELSKALINFAMSGLYNLRPTLAQYFCYIGNILNSYPTEFDQLLTDQMLHLLASFTNGVCRVLNLPKQRSQDFVNSSTPSPFKISVNDPESGAKSSLNLFARHLIISSSWVLSKLQVKEEAITSLRRECLAQVIVNISSMLEIADDLEAKYILSALAPFSCPTSSFVRYLAYSNSLLSFSSKEVVKPTHQSSTLAFEIISNLTAWDEDVAMAIAVDYAILHKIPQIHSHLTVDISLILNFLTNFASCGKKAILHILDTPGIIETLLELLDQPIFDGKIICDILRSCVLTASDKQICTLLDKGFIESHARFFDFYEIDRNILTVIESFEVIAKSTIRANYYREFLIHLNNNDFRDHLEQFSLNCINGQLSSKASKFLDDYALDIQDVEEMFMSD